MTANYSQSNTSYPAFAWQDPSTTVDPFMASRNEYDSRRDNSHTLRDSSTVHNKQTPPEIKDMKKRRKVRTVASGVAGGVLGLVVLGPVGGIAGGVGGAMVAKKMGKRKEKRRMDKIEAGHGHGK